MADDLIFHLSMQIDGQSFSASGTQLDVLRLYREWQTITGLTLDAATETPEPDAVPFNAPRLVKH